MITPSKQIERKSKKVRSWKSVTITIERVVEETKSGALTENNTLFYLINAKYSHGAGVGFRADTQLSAWSKMMQEIYL